MIEAAETDERVRALPSRQAHTIGSYLGVPVLMSDGRLFGTLCVLDPAPHTFQPDHLDLMIILSRWLRFFLEQDPITLEDIDVPT